MQVDQLGWERTELLVEIADALLVPGHDGDAYLEHVGRISDFLAMAPSDPAASALRKARAVLERRSGYDLMQFMMEDEPGAADAVHAVRTSLPGWPLFVYHGTSSKHLASIAARGLLPAFSRTHWSTRVDAEHLKQGVFFTASRRAAYNWSLSASHTLKGTPRKDGVSAVIRLRADGLQLVPDRRAAQRDCLISAGPVIANNAEVLTGKVVGFPAWQQLTEVVRQLPPNRDR